MRISGVSLNQQNSGRDKATKYPAFQSESEVYMYLEENMAA